jgi:hypothetical protein
LNSKKIIQIWNELKNTAKVGIKLRKIGEGLIVIFDPASQTIKIAIQVKEPWTDSMFPKWSGILFTMDKYALPLECDYLVLEIVDTKQSEIFVFVCLDLIDKMGAAEGIVRDSIVQETISQWDKFFKEIKGKLMSRELQQGLFAELKFLYKLLKSNLISNQGAINSWKGAERSYHDFQYRNRVVEVKSTTGKKPKKMMISNEKQLNDNNLSKLLLLATSLTNVDGGETLEQIVEKINIILDNEPILQDIFNMKLLKYGLKMEDIEKYPTGYIIEKNQSFKISNDFPRIIEGPSGVADIKYSVLIDSCSEFEFDINDLVEVFIND